HTFDLESVGAFLEQAEPVAAMVNQLVRFARSEKQHTLIEGSNLVPGRFPPVDGVALVEVYLNVRDPEQHRRMLGGPTHNRALSERQVRNCRMLQEYVLGEAARCGRPVFEYTEAHVRTVELIGA